MELTSDYCEYKLFIQKTIEIVIVKFITYGIIFDKLSHFFVLVELSFLNLCPDY